MKVIYNEGPLKQSAPYTMMVDSNSTDKYGQTSSPQKIRYNLQTLSLLQGHEPKVNQEPVVAGKYIIIYDLLASGEECMAFFNHQASSEELAAYVSAFSPIMDADELLAKINQFRALDHAYDVEKNNLIVLQ